VGESIVDTGHDSVDIGGLSAVLCEQVCRQRSVFNHVSEEMVDDADACDEDAELSEL
jgi:hypothetical protein